MKKVDLKRTVMVLTFVSMMCTVPALRAYGQDEAVTPGTAETVATWETTETTEADAVAAAEVSEAEMGLAFERFYFYDMASMQTDAPAYRRKSPFLAWFLSWLYPGIGQFYNGSIGKGITMTSLATGGLGLCIVAAKEEDDSMGSIGALVIVGTALWSMIDAPISAGRINRRNAALTWNVGEGAQLKLRPDISYENSMKGLQPNKNPYYGLLLKMEF